MIDKVKIKLKYSLIETVSETFEDSISLRKKISVV